MCVESDKYGYITIYYWKVINCILNICNYWLNIIIINKVVKLLIEEKSFKKALIVDEKNSKIFLMKRRFVSVC